ncbi:hypothetical protein P280DRAFT_551003 [Massarina eburnea CBS 473.64]|uniref:Uncharacterized protein n=1 Tax=Massarina eburnea CBS 473.64 TaxID=1395130 RepID=A0A6A6RTM0_9PLEO|nr:hypothetical protein P280DRAFT_551003 [Massarina eburnea CBS 473.64]
MVSWTSDKDAILLVGIIEFMGITASSQLLEHLATKIGDGCTPKAVSHRLNNLKKSVKNPGSTTPAGTPVKTFLNTPSKAVGTPSKAAGTPSKAAGTPSKTAGTPSKAPATPKGRGRPAKKMAVTVSTDEDDGGNPFATPPPKKRGRKPKKVIDDEDDADVDESPVKKVKDESAVELTQLGGLDNESAHEMV